METKKISPESWRILSLICIGGLLLLGLTQIYGPYSTSRLQQYPLSVQVDAIQQSRGTSCGEAVITMAYNYAYPQNRITEQQVIDYAVSQGFYTEDLAPFTSPANMVKIARFYADDISTGNVINSNQGLMLLIRQLQNGEPVIIDVLSQFSDRQSEAHFVVVTGISVDASRGNAIVIRYNDPLTGKNESGNWAGREGVWNAWQKNGDPGGSGWWLVIPPPS